MKLNQPTLFRQSLVLLVALIVFGQISASLLFFYFSQRPRMQVFAGIAARQVATVKNTLDALPPAARSTYLAQINQGGAMSLSGTPPETAEVAPRGVPRMVLDLLTADLAGSGVSMSMSTAPHQRLVAHWQDQSGSWWITFPDLPLAAGSAGVWVSVSVLIGLLSLSGALLIQKRLHRPLNELVHAARHVGAGAIPAPLDENGPREIATLARGFNRMVHDLRAIEQQRALLLAGVSHDLRTPLTKVRLALAILEGNVESDLHNQMVRGIEEMDRLLGQFLDFARIDSDEPESRLDLRTLALECLRASAVDQALFDSTALQPAWVVARPQMMRRVFMNLIDNAVKYGRLSLERPARLALVVTPDLARFSIADAGPGFALQDKAALLRPFVRGVDPASPGSGLGLSIVARIIELHQGQLELCESSAGGGEVRFQLPVQNRGNPI